MQPWISKPVYLIKLHVIATPKAHIRIIENCLEGNRQAEYELYNLYAKALYSTCIRMVKYVPQAEDLLQEVFVKIFNALPRYDTSKNFYTWANRIAINACINHQAKKGIDYTYEYDSAMAMRVADNESQSEAEVSVEMVQKAIMKLPDGYREILSLYLLEGYDHKEISGILKISESTSKSQYSRAKNKLRTLMSATAWT